MLCGAETQLDPAQQERLRALCAADLDWDHLVDEARRHGVDPLLYRHLAAVGPPRVPAAALDRLRAHAETNAVRNRMLAAELAKVLAALEGRGVAAMPYKGPVLAASVYGDLSLRRFADLDVLVRRSGVLRAKEALAPLGYAPRLTLTAAQERAYLASQCEYAFDRDRGLPWRGDFAAARNAALDRARGRFILYIDADERLLPVSRGEVDAVLADPSAVGHTVRFRPQRGYTRYREYRIFRSDPRIRFRGAIHETMLPGLREVAARDGLRIAPTDLALDHVGYEGDQAPKHRRNLPLLRARLERDPEHVFCWHHLGRALAGLGDARGASDAWRRGVEAVRGGVEPSPADSLPYASLLGQQMDQGRLDQGLLDEARARFPDNHLIAWLDGRRLVAAGRHEEAIGVFQALAAVDADTFMDEAIAYDARIFGVWPLDALGLCCFRLARFEDSARYYASAEAAADDAAPYRARRRLAEARLGRAATVRVSPPPPPS